MRILASIVLIASIGGFALAQAPQAQRPRRAGMQLSCQAWTFRELTVLDTIDTVNSLGIRNVEFFPGQKLSKDNPIGFDHNASPEVIAEVKARLQAKQVRAVAYGVVGLGENEEENRKVFEFAKTMGIGVINSEPPEAALSMIGKLCREYNIKVGIHNHPKPSHYWSPETVLKAVDGVDSFVGACADTGHWYRSGINPVDALKQLKGRITSLHFKDLNTEKEDVPYGTGAGDVKAQLQELVAQGFRGPISIEYERTSGAELLENVRKCVQWYRATMREIRPAVRPRP